MDQRLDDPRVASFAPIPREPLPFPTILIGSHNDHYMGYRAAVKLARQWGATFADAGKVGHINADSGLGEWPFGLLLLEQLIRRASHPGPGSTSLPLGEAQQAPSPSAGLFR